MLKTTTRPNHEVIVHVDYHVCGGGHQHVFDIVGSLVGLPIEDSPDLVIHVIQIILGMILS